MRLYKKIKKKHFSTGILFKPKYTISLCTSMLNGLVLHNCNIITKIEGKETKIKQALVKNTTKTVQWEND